MTTYHYVHYLLVTFHLDSRKFILISGGKTSLCLNHFLYDSKVYILKESCYSILFNQIIQNMMYLISIDKSENLKGIR